MEIVKTIKMSQSELEELQQAVLHLQNLTELVAEICDETDCANCSFGYCETNCPKVNKKMNDLYDFNDFIDGANFQVEG